MAEIDKKIVQIQKSTRTFFASFIPLHDKLRLHSNWYYNWHLWKGARFLHLVILVISILGIASMTFLSFRAAKKPNGVQASPGTCYWVGVTNPDDWNDANNWSNASGGAGGTCEGGTIPGALTDVVFDTANNNSCNIDVDVTVASIFNAWVGYTGTLNGGGNNVNVSGNFTFDSGSLNLNSGTWTISGDWDTRNLASINVGTSTVIMNGTDKILRTKHSTSGYFWKLTIDGTIDVATVTGDGTDITNRLTVNEGKTLTISGLLSIDSGGQAVINGTINGSGTFSINAGGNLGTGGTLNVNVDFGSITWNVNMPARVYGKNVYAFCTSGAGGSSSLVMLAGTHTINGNLTINVSSNHGVILDAVTNNPNVDIAGHINIFGSGSGTKEIRAGNGNWNVAGNLSLSNGTFTAGNSTVIMDGGGSQSITSSGSFHNLTNASGALTFQNACTVSNTFVNTAGSQLVFAAGSNYNFANINIAGAAGNNILMRSSSAGTQWNFNVSQASPAVSYVNVQDSNASGGSRINATSNCIDSGNNINWNFGACHGFNHVSLTPASVVLAPKQSQTFSAKAINGAGAEMTGISASYTATGGTITAAGRYTAPAKKGTYYVTATSACGGEATAKVTVTKDFYVDIEISPESASLDSGYTQQFKATLFTNDGEKIVESSLSSTSETEISEEIEEFINPQVSFVWSIEKGGGEISEYGLFIAANKEGVFQDTVRVEAVLTSDPAGENPETYTASDNATVKVKEVAAPETLEEEIEKYASEIGLAPVTAAAATALALAIPLAAAAQALPYLSQLFNFLSFLGENLYIGLGLKRRKKHWGVVFNNINKKPFAFARVLLYSWPDKRLRDSTITNNLGEFGFLVPAGKYYVKVDISEFKQIALEIKDKEKEQKYLPGRSDGYYSNIYYKGEIIELKGEGGEKRPVTISIPLEAKKKLPLSERIYRSINRVLRALDKIRIPLIIIGTILAILAAVYRQTWLDYGILGLYVIIWGVELVTRFYQVKPTGLVVATENQKPLDLVLLRLTKTDTGKIVSTSVTAKDGKFVFTAPAGNYKIKAVKAGFKPQETKDFHLKSIGSIGRIKIALESE